MSGLCSCSGGVPGWGLADCFTGVDRATSIAFQRLKNGSTVNSISPLITQISWEALLYTKVAGTRISVLNDIKTYTSDRDDEITETIDGIDYSVSQGKKMISFVVVKPPMGLQNYINSIACQSTGFYLPTASNQLIGTGVAGTTTLKPIPIQKGTLTTKAIDGTKETFAKLQVTFQVDERYQDGDTLFIDSDQIQADLNNTNPMIQAVGSNPNGLSASTTTKIEVDLAFALSGKISTTGLDALTNFDDTDFFAIYNTTTSAAVVVSAISESATVSGRYTLSFTAQTLADVLEVSATNLAPFNFETLTVNAL